MLLGDPPSEPQLASQTIQEKMTEHDWVLLSLYFCGETDKAQTEQVLQWCAANSENLAIFEDAQIIFYNHKLPTKPDFDSTKAFKKLCKKITDS